MSALRPGTTAQVVFNGTDVPGYLLGMIVPAHSTVSGYIETALRNTGLISAAVAAVSSGSVTVSVTTSQAVDDGALYNLIRNAVSNSYVDLSGAQSSFSVVGGLPAATNYGGFITELTTQVGSNTGALGATSLNALWQGVNAAFQGNGLIVIGGLAVLLLVLMRRD